VTVATDTISAWMSAADPYDYDAAEIQSAQLELADQRLHDLRQKIPALDHLADTTGVDAIHALDDAVPVLFSHESYKSYPDALVRGGRWQYLSVWLDRFTSVDGIGSVNMAGVGSVDEWMARLREAGFHVFGSSGTSGKSSLFAISDSDRAYARRGHEIDFAWGPGLRAGASLSTFVLAPRFGFYRGSDDIQNSLELYRGADDTTWMSLRPLLLADINRMGELRRRIASGMARPSEISALRTESTERDNSVLSDLGELVTALERARDTPVLIWGGWPQQYRLTELLRARGHTGPYLNPGSVIQIAGGKKGTQLPEDFEARVREFWGLDPDRYLLRYGCSEIVVLNPACSAGRYHIGPWVIPFVLDKAGTRVLSSNAGQVEGRMAFLDLTSEGRWGGVITGDRVSLRARSCECGRRGASVSDISRYMDLEEGEDKLSCAGTIESYVRGEIAL
jgi:hypothetical protein